MKETRRVASWCFCYYHRIIYDKNNYIFIDQYTQRYLRVNIVFYLAKLYARPRKNYACFFLFDIMRVFVQVLLLLSWRVLAIDSGAIFKYF